MKKKLRLKQKYIDALGVVLLYLIIIVGIILINARLGQLGWKDI